MDAGQGEFSHLSGPGPASEILQEKVSFSPLFARVLEKRGLTDFSAILSYLSAPLDDLQNPFAMKGMAEAAQRIRQAVQNGEKILVHGDYDVDGITGSAIVAGTLAHLGGDFQTFLPDRSEDGYGVSERAIRRAQGQGASLLITVDCGITAAEEIQAARSLGMDVIVIDHHRIPREGLPPATIILNPLQEDCAYPFKELSAGGLAFKLAQALLGIGALEFLDLAALSTVCDVAPLKGENRVLVKHGLAKLSARSRLGLKALSEASGIRSRDLNVGHVGFMLGPRINAAGRMSSPDIALRLLLTGQPQEALSLARALDGENKNRQHEERQVTVEAHRQVEKFFNFNRDRVIVAASYGWHPGVIGIVASRLVERYHRPSVVIALEKEKGKGSGRSIKNFNLFQALESCHDLFEEFGGHEQAAGLSIKEENIPEFRKRVNEYACTSCDPSVFEKKIGVDLEVQLADLNAGFLEELKGLEPCGAGNPKPVFSTADLELKGKPERFGEGYKFWLTDGIRTFEAQWSGRAALDFALEKGMKVNTAYSLKSKTWDGMESLILDLKEIKPCF